MPVFFLLLVVVPILEIFVIFKVGGLIGFWPTVGFTILTAALGSSLARLQALRVWADWSNSLKRMESPAHSVLEGLLILVGGVLLLTPGFITDAIGFSMLLPWTRSLLLRPVKRLVDKHLSKLRVINLGSQGAAPRGERPDVVDTTYESIDESPPRLK